jgi:hypothetical protein
VALWLRNEHGSPGLQRGMSFRKESPRVRDFMNDREGQREIDLSAEIRDAQ